MEERTQRLSWRCRAEDAAKRQAEEANVSKTPLRRGGEPRPAAAAERRAAVRVGTGAQRRRGRRVTEIAEHIDSSLRAAEELLDGMLDIARLDSGAMRPDLDVSDCGDCSRTSSGSTPRSLHVAALRLRVVTQRGAGSPATACCCGASCRTTWPTHCATRGAAGCSSVAAARASDADAPRQRHRARHSRAPPRGHLRGVHAARAAVAMGREGTRTRALDLRPHRAAAGARAGVAVTTGPRLDVRGGVPRTSGRAHADGRGARRRRRAARWPGRALRRQRPDDPAGDGGIAGALGRAGGAGGDARRGAVRVCPRRHRRRARRLSASTTARTGSR